MNNEVKHTNTSKGLYLAGIAFCLIFVVASTIITFNTPSASAQILKWVGTGIGGILVAVGIIVMVRK
jgi:threonine/homoserine/homoserine lactone efflux protein